MAVDTHRTPDAPTGDPSGRDRTQAEGRGWLYRATSIWALAIGFIAVTIIAAGPMRVFDYTLNRRWLYLFNPDLVWFAQNVLDSIAGQAVCLPVLAIVAIVLSRRTQSWRPIGFALATEAAFFIGVGGLKFLLARPATTLHDPRFFQGGLLEFGDRGISYPSGHTSEAVLVYGAVVYLIANYSGASRQLVRVLCWVVVAITANSVVVSFLLGWHWITDLIGGLLAGGLFLRILVQYDTRARRRLQRRANTVAASP
ncbi:phosphatase PAP2 family protein [Brevibacterium marinum]|uniref:Membrane-associated phospholipid phosphatase n=1 Tax=Brevibacterium marinum TaxID=418643 RepID=A0A846S1L6_9MICO|nr:phosphatase PAP2 family protein [Brevibacterium marinum]NJC58056.1 membrane-associated phospholipid phosphatase [Brevibacterium marinum]